MKTKPDFPSKFEDIFKFEYPFDQFDREFQNQISTTHKTLRTLKAAIDFIQDSELSDEDKLELLEVLTQEVDLITFAQRTKNNVINI